MINMEPIVVRAARDNYVPETIDDATLQIGRIHKVADALRVLREQGRRAPPPGWETCVDPGTVHVSCTLPGFIPGWAKYRTWLYNNCGVLKLRTWIDVGSTTKEEICEP